jgi:anti-sigma regulatory factor (Ser/Thr protein kinase)
MPPTVCPSCGSSLSSAGGAVPAICPGCCALLHDTDGAVPSAPPLARPRKPKPVLRMAIGRDPSAPAAARHALVELRPALGGPELRVCQLLTSELVTNVLLHAPTRSAWSAADMRVRMYPDRVRVEVRDDGLSFRPRSRTPDHDMESGWGLHLVAELADEWGIEPGVQNCVWFALRLSQGDMPRVPPASAPAPVA